MTTAPPPVVAESNPAPHPTSFAASEPAVALGIAGAIVAYVLSALTTHGVITGDQASSYDKTWVPVVAAALVALVGFVVRRFVSPASKLAHYKALAERGAADLGLTDADYQMISSIVEARLQQAFGSITLNVTGGGGGVGVPVVASGGGSGGSAGSGSAGVLAVPPTAPVTSSGGAAVVLPDPEPFIPATADTEPAADSVVA